jgi:hypothetical protein
MWVAALVSLHVVHGRVLVMSRGADQTEYFYARYRCAWSAVFIDSMQQS